ncbi:hypothetical protein Q8A64_15720 [Oxalobacteraceae bacterium R-40]|uniref:Uncharacterized protein n=1 Tax=Keguizhuia sedimenti TaxID=3064264 RepID=A0ABU1BSD7_9BURK|nr:hypothetical protein [Oxalobacteraceae bacterium R-40]
MPAFISTGFSRKNIKGGKSERAASRKPQGKKEILEPREGNMGYQCEIGTKTRAPLFFGDQSNIVSWSGKDVAAMTEYDGWTMRRFIEKEAYRIGYSEGQLLPAWNPFDPEMLFGEPHKLWDYYYLTGRADKAGCANAVQPEPPAMPAVEYAIWPGILSTLEDLSNEFERSYKRIGVKKKSSLWGLIFGMCGWFNQSDDFAPVYDEKGWRFI